MKTSIKPATGSEIGGGAAPESAFAQSCANADSFEIQVRLEKCRQLEPPILAQARIVDQAIAANDEAWDAILPGLDDQQRLRSRRGKYQKLADQAGLETFEDWWERICTENGFKIPLRTVQDRLKKYRDRNRTEPRLKAKQGPSLTRQQQKRVILAGILGHELAHAVSRTTENAVKDAAHAFRDGAPTCEELHQQLDALSGVEPAEAGEHTSTPVREVEIKSGNAADLELLIDESCGAQISDCLDGLDGAAVANVAGRVANFILQRRGHIARGDGQYHVSITYTPAAPAFRRQWKPKKTERVN